MIARAVNHPGNHDVRTAPICGKGEFESFGVRPNALFSQPGAPIGLHAVRKLSNACLVVVAELTFVDGGESCAHIPAKRVL